MTRIEFVIDELVLIGFAPGDRHRIADAVANELATLGADAQLAVRDAALSGSIRPALRAPDVSMVGSPHGGAPTSDSIGSGVGRSITQAIAGSGGGA